MIKFDLIPAWAYALAFCVSLGAAGAGGWKLRDADYQKHLRADAEAAQRASEAAREVEGKNETTSQEVGTKVEEAKETIRYVTQTLVKEIPVYVTEQADDRCVVPLGAARVLDAAATGNPTISYGPGESADQASGHELSGVVASVVQNYGYTRELEATVIGWQEWYERVRKDWPQ
jgi:hypothetical protein